MRRVSRLVRPLNTMFGPVAARQRTDPDAVFDKAVRKAEAASGGSAAGDEEFVEGFRTLLHFVSEVDTVSYLGWTAVVDELARRMENRFRVRRLIAETPAIAEEPIDRPIIVTGLPRTATTLAHKVLAHPEGNRAPLMWELRATDRADVGEEIRRRRLKVADRAAAFGQRFAPSLEVIHPLAADSPEECVFALPHGLHWLVQFHMPRYRDWLDEYDYLPDYRYLKRVLQVLQYGTPRKRWVLKSPYHLHNLDNLLKVFPDAKIMWTHRDPHTVMASWCSLMETGIALCNRRYDPTVIGSDWLEMLSWMITRGRELRLGLSRENIVDVSYHQLTADPYGQLPGIFEKLGMEWTDTDDGNLDMVLARPGMRRNHEYSLRYYGLDFDQVDEAFGDYGRMVNNMV